MSRYNFLSTRKCHTCGRSFRPHEVDHLCPECFELAGWDNTCNDNGQTPEEAGLTTRRITVLRTIRSKGGDWRKAAKANDFLFPDFDTLSIPDIVIRDTKAPATKTHGHVEAKAIAVQTPAGKTITAAQYLSLIRAHLAINPTGHACVKNHPGCAGWTNGPCSRKLAA